MKRIMIITGIAILLLWQGLQAQERGYTSPYNRPNGYSGHWGHPNSNPTLSTYGEQGMRDQMKKNVLIYNKILILLTKYIESELAKEKGLPLSSEEIMTDDAQEYLLSMLNKMDPSDVEILMKKALQAKDLLLKE